MNTINAYNGSGDAPTVADYTAAGVSGVNETNLDDVNAQVANPNNPDSTPEKIQALVIVAALKTINE